MLPIPAYIVHRTLCSTAIGFTAGFALTQSSHQAFLVSCLSALYAFLRTER